MYQQKMCYIDLYKNGLKCGNMGHVRLEWDESQYRFQVSLCRLDKQTLVSTMIKRNGGKQQEKLHDIAIIHGKGSYQSDWIPVWGDEGQLIFEASGGIYGICSFPQMGETDDDMKFESVKTEEKNQEAVFEDTEKVSENQEIADTEKVPEEPEPMQAAETEQELQSAPTVQTGKEPERDMLEEIRKERETLAATKLLDNKWDQLCSMYEKVRPVGGNIEFIKIRPEDFVILRQEYQGLVRNSFLLHGYYNYHYILLGKYPDKYYIGVPGIMHEQERMAAAMFGFIGFERALEPEQEKKGQNIQKGEGNFGYYMMEVAI